MSIFFKRDFLDTVESVFATIDHENKDDVLAFIEKERAALDKKNEAAKKRAANKRAEGDALRGRIESVLTDEPMTVDAILATLNEEGLTSAKVVSRMTQLIKAEKAHKENVKVDGRTLVGYTRA